MHSWLKCRGRVPSRMDSPTGASLVLASLARQDRLLRAAFDNLCQGLDAVDASGSPLSDQQQEACWLELGLSGSAVYHLAQIADFTARTSAADQKKQRPSQLLRCDCSSAGDGRGSESAQSQRERECVCESKDAAPFYRFPCPAHNRGILIRQR